MSICIWPHHLLLLGLSNRLPPSSASILAVWHVPMLLVLREMKKNRLKKCALVRNWRENLGKKKNEEVRERSTTVEAVKVVEVVRRRQTTNAWQRESACDDIESTINHA